MNDVYFTELIEEAGVFMLRKTVVLAVIVLAAFMLAGCEKKYTFDFQAERDAVNSEGAWSEQTEILYTALGAYLNDDALTTPFRFQGDFTVEVTFLVNVAETNYLQWLEFYLIDSDNWDYMNNIGLGMYMASPTGAVHWVGQHGQFPEPSQAGILPGLLMNAVNYLKISRTGDLIDIKLNQHTYDSFTISETNKLNDYNFIIVGYDDTNSLQKGVYIQKVVISYESGNRIKVANE